VSHAKSVRRSSKSNLKDINERKIVKIHKIHTQQLEEERKKEKHKDTSHPPLLSTTFICF
jgi:hypothetical protein